MTATLIDRDASAFGERNPDSHAPVLFIAGHHRNRVPASLRNLGLTEKKLARHIGYGISVAWIAEYLSDRIDAPLVHTNIPASAHEGNESSGADTDHRRPAQFHTLMRERGTPCPLEIGFIWNEDGRLALPLIEALHADTTLTIGDNEPYSGRDGGYSLYEHPEAAGHPHIGVEFRQDLVSAPKDAHRWVEIFGNALEIAVSSLTLCFSGSLKRDWNRQDRGRRHHGQSGRQIRRPDTAGA